MKLNIKKILSGILFSSLASIPNASGQTASPDQSIISASSFLAESEEKKKDRTFSFVLPTSNRQLLLAAHSSHRSHSSHSSHSSHRSSTGGTSYSTSSSSSRLPTITHPSTTTSSPSTTTPSKTTTTKPASSTTKTGSTSTTKSSESTPKTYSLGDRDLREGMTGNDVSKLVSLLVLYKYLDKQESGLNTGCKIHIQ